MTPEAEQVVADKYQLLRPLARGGMGTVWVARHLGLHIEVALKFMDEQRLDSESARPRFEREARAAARLKNPHVTQILDYGVHEDAPYIAMELLEGEDLKVHLARRGRIPLDETAEIARQLCLGLERAHEEGIVHRDLKPSNIFLAKSGQQQIVKILDFGVARDNAALAGNATATGSLIGSPRFMSPEQARGEPVDHRSDLWSVGAVVYEMLTGRTPFPGSDVMTVLHAICHTHIVPPSHHIPELGTATDRFMARALDRARVLRFQSAAELSRELQAVAQTHTAAPIAQANVSATASTVVPGASQTASLAPAVAPAIPFAPTMAPAVIKPSSRWWVPVLLFFLLSGLLVFGGIVYVMWRAMDTARAGGVGTRRLDPSVLDGLKLATTPAALAKVVGGNVRENVLPGKAVVVDLDHDDFAWMNFNWPKGRDDQVVSVSVYLRDGKTMPAEVLARGRTQFGSQLSEVDHQLSGYGINFAVQDTYVALNALDLTQPRLSEQVQLLFRALCYVALGRGQPVSTDELRAVLDLSHPFAALGRIALSTPQEAAEAHTKTLFPSAMPHGGGWGVGLDHPWMINATLTWDERSGRFSAVLLYFPSGFDLDPHREPLSACLSPEEGAPEVLIGNNHVNVYNREGTRQDAWQRAIEALDRCGR